MIKDLENLESLTETQKKILAGFADPKFYDDEKGRAEKFCEKYSIHPSHFYASFNNPYFCKVFFNQQMQFVMASIPGVIRGLRDATGRGSVMAAKLLFDMADRGLKALDEHWKQESEGSVQEVADGITDKFKPAQLKELWRLIEGNLEKRGISHKEVKNG